MAVTAALVKELREKTGAGMLDCKKALVETNGDLDKAVEFLRKKGIAKAAKKAGRVAAEGVVVSFITDDMKKGAILEFNSETDFVAKNEEFQALASKVTEMAATGEYADVAAIKAAKIGDKSVEDTVTELVAKIGENMNVRRFVNVESPVDGFVQTYIHLGGKRGVILTLKGENSEENQTVAKDIAMHVAAMSPRFLTRDEVTQEVLDKEKEIARVLLEKEGKPANIIEKILIGKMNKFYEENCLLDQKFVKDSAMTVSKYAKGKVEVLSYDMLVLGEGIEKEEVDFAEEVRRTAGQ